ncbi:molecular chaperone DjlA [Marinobacter lutaoensis]|uniref:Molecular chaperone DjlA n=1 Tax=Marinobacter lutaoensis TaxID=135739 RepID=A0A1V2DRV7_9GAMM|nr:DnaJ domain-containing protein [Marinobacter lutaoensis]ONF43454.1 molecular chaperone DjlA [Marinobacter lutaoensis]
MASPPDPQMPPRLQRRLARLLEQLASHEHQTVRLIARYRLPRWCRRPLFFLLGYIARADGRVTEADIDYAEDVIRALGLSRRQRRTAIRWFQKGKGVERLPAWRGLALHLSHWLWPAPALRVAACLCHATQLQGPPSKPRQHRCEDAILQIGLPLTVSDDLLASYRAAYWPSDLLPEAPENYDQACQLLGLSRHASLPQLKQAYRRRISECHPDKLSQRQRSNRELALAKERLLRYQQAWELIKRRHRS